MITLYSSHTYELTDRSSASVIEEYEEAGDHFFLERTEGETLNVQSIGEGAVGFYCSWSGPGLPGNLEAIGRGPHGLVLADDGGGNPLVIDSACVIDRDSAIAVVERFRLDGGRSEAVTWGHGLVSTSYDEEEGLFLRAIGEPSGPMGWLPGGYRGAVGRPVDLALTQTASWRILSHLDVQDTGWLAILANHPMTRLRRLVVKAVGGSLDALPAALAVLPELEELVLMGEPVLTLPRLVSPSLRRIWLGLGAPFDTVDEPDADWSSRVASRLALCELPALEETSIEKIIDVDIDL